jgi:hypothetical protein
MHLKQDHPQGRRGYGRHLLPVVTVLDESSAEIFLEMLPIVFVSSVSVGALAPLSTRPELVLTCGENTFGYSVGPAVLAHL